MSYERQGEGEDHRLGGAEIDKVVIAEGGVEAVGVVVPHVGGEVGVDVGVAVAGSEGKEEEEPTEHREPTSPGAFTELG